MTYPFMTDPIPPGHGEALRQPDADRTYVVLVTLGDVTRTDSRWTKLDDAIAERNRVRKELVAAGYLKYHVAVQDEDDPDRGDLHGGEDDGDD